MGGFGSGRYGGRPVKEDGLTIDLALMLRKGWISEGSKNAGTLSWSRNDEPYASISYTCSLTDPEDASLTLRYRRQRHGEDWVDREQFVRLDYTLPHYGGRRWWMLCPVRGERIGKLYLPAGGDIFAGRKAWRLGYRSQRVSSRDRASERLFALQRKLGCDQGWEQPLFKPKGMWQRTFDRHMERYWELDAQIALEMMALIGLLKRR